MPRLDQYEIDPSGCWVWTGHKNPSGYGYVSTREKTTGAHRFVYEALKALIPSGLELDHLCRRKDCVNPDHLEPVTAEENRRRRAESQTRCAQGHEFTPDNTRIRKKTGQRLCIECKRRWGRQRYWRKKTNAVLELAPPLSEGA